MAILSVTSFDDSGPGSLREVIEEANASPGLDQLVFALPIDVPAEETDPVPKAIISLQSPLPAITDTLEIFGFSQPGARPRTLDLDPTENDAVVVVTIDGSAIDRGAFPAPIGVDVQAANSFVSGLNVTGFDVGVSISTEGAQGNLVLANNIYANDTGVLITAPNNFLGTASPQSRNVISANRIGLELSGPLGTGNLVEGNFFGTNFNGDSGVFRVGLDEIQRLSILGAGTGTFTLTFEGATTTPLDIDSTAAEVDSALEALSSIGAGNVIVEGGPLPSSPLSIRFVNDLGTRPVDTLQAQVVDIDAGFIVSVEEIREGILPDDPTSPPLSGPTGNTESAILILSSNNTIGGTVAAALNVIANSGQHGVHIQGPDARGNELQNNLIGVVYTADESRFPIVALGNDGFGVLVEDAPGNIIGGLGEERRNVIGDSGLDGVRIVGDSARENRVQGNFIGFNEVSDALFFLPNRDGVSIQASDNLVGGLPGEAVNVIAINTRHGVLIEGATSRNNFVQGNLIGLNPEGASDFGNSFDGVRIDGSPDNIIGGIEQGSTNVISGNDVGVRILGATATNNRIQGNFIGTTIGGLEDLGNAREGILIQNASETLIGGSEGIASNVISGNDRGIRIDGPLAVRNRVQNNLIGLGSDAETRLGNEIEGIIISGGASDNTIGGERIQEGNRIAFNVIEGIFVEDGDDNAILSNRIFANGGLGIDLAPGSNDDQPAPVLTTVVIEGSQTLVSGSIVSTPSSTVRVQFFSNFVGDPSNGGANQELAGEIFVDTDGTGLATFTAVPLDFQPPDDANISATVTNVSGSTSEFSNLVPVASALIQFSTAIFEVDESVGMATIVVTRSQNEGAEVTVGFAANAGTATPNIDFVPTSGLLSFVPGALTTTFDVTILDDAASEGDETVTLTLFNLSSNAEPGDPFTATLLIRASDGGGDPGDPGDGGGTPTPSAPPVVTNLLLETDPSGIRAIVIAFDRPVDPTQLVDLRSYGFTIQGAGRDRLFETPDDVFFGITQAESLAEDSAVRLRIDRALPTSTFFQVRINEVANSAVGEAGVAGSEGLLLDGDGDGVPGGTFIARFASGRTLNYRDAAGNFVSFGITGSGELQLEREPSGDARTLRVVTAPGNRPIVSGRLRAPLFRAAPPQFTAGFQLDPEQPTRFFAEGGAVFPGPNPFRQSIPAGLRIGQPVNRFPVFDPGQTPLPRIVAPAGVRFDLSDPPFLIGRGRFD